ncbi:hypothetical protein HXX76_004520 [Chlamydomonas incerta]|uniref:Uncharacterized protein n=1 Tax=Chlamydomonas incerta TaxID=51695 RepID=A0A835W6I0_CHLIN|nr:hypothetical protein HXX76_004520 [Chlamydomonas incerta]|eukprot:KAG2439153.1 hypothetical protein HXX76_004520 [Chlamydomonas incerta]
MRLGVLAAAMAFILTAAADPAQVALNRVAVSSGALAAILLSPFTLGQITLMLVLGFTGKPAARFVALLYACGVPFVAYTVVATALTFRAGSSDRGTKIQALRDVPEAALALMTALVLAGAACGVTFLADEHVLECSAVGISLLWRRRTAAVKPEPTVQPDVQEARPHAC